MVVTLNNLYVLVEGALTRWFYKYGERVGHHPVLFSLVPLFTFGLLGLGILRMDHISDTEYLYTPVSSRIFKDRIRVKEHFPDSTAYNFDAFGLLDIPIMGIVIFRFLNESDNSPSGSNLFRENQLKQVRAVDRSINQLVVEHDGKNYTLDDLCAHYVTGECAKDGVNIIQEQFQALLKNRTVSYPLFQSFDLTWVLAGVYAPNNTLISARILKLRYYLRVDKRQIGLKWADKFVDLMRNTKLGDGVEIAYASSQSLEQELEKGTKGDIIYFSLTMVLMVVYSVLVTSGGDAVSSRALLACGGVLAAALSIVGSLGLLSLLGFQYVNFVGIMPFLVIGIGVDDMFLLMSAWGESISMPGLTTPQRLGVTFANAGIGITITSVTDFLAFLIGYSSDFIVVRHFCIFTGLAVIMCYLCTATLFGACLALHGDRVYAGHHWLTCQPAKTREELKEQGSSCMKIYCCGGTIPRESWEDESPFERLPRIFLPRLILNPVVKVLLMIAFLIYLGVSIWGAIALDQGMLYKDLVLESSYYHRFSLWDTEYFGERIAISFVIDEPINYTAEEGQEFLKLLTESQKDESINSNFLICWLDQYMKSKWYNGTSTASFMDGLIHGYLPENKPRMNDVIFDKTNTTIIASRCYVLTVNLINPFQQALLMQRMRKLADFWHPKLPVFAFQPSFVVLEHTVAILPNTLQTVGTAVGVMCLVTFIFLPQPLMVLLVTLNIVLILVGVFGSMYFLNITYSGITMIHLIMSVGFSVDFSAHICSAYLMSSANTRQERAKHAIIHASGPIFNGGMSSLVGVAMLLMSESYIFKSFFKIMSMVIMFGAVHAVFFMPVVLSYIGPEKIHNAGRNRVVPLNTEINANVSTNGTNSQIQNHIFLNLKPSFQDLLTTSKNEHTQDAQQESERADKLIKTDSSIQDSKQSKRTFLEPHDSQGQGSAKAWNMSKRIAWTDQNDLPSGLSERILQPLPVTELTDTDSQQQEIDFKNDNDLIDSS